MNGGNSQSEDRPPASEPTTVTNTKSIFSYFSGVLPKYFDSEWSFAQCRLTDSHVICAIKEKTLIAISQEGNYYTAEFDPKAGGEC